MAKAGREARAGRSRWLGGAAGVAVARDLAGTSYRKIADSLSYASKVACAVACSHICKKIKTLRPSDTTRRMRKRKIRVVRAGDARIVFRLDPHAR